jgi:hypothetical protein
VEGLIKEETEFSTQALIMIEKNRKREPSVTKSQKMEILPFLSLSGMQDLE